MIGMDKHFLRHVRAMMESLDRKLALLDTLQHETEHLATMLVSAHGGGRRASSPPAARHRHRGDGFEQ